MRRIGLVWRTVRHLTARQLIYQVLARLRGQSRLRLPELAPVFHRLAVPIQAGPIQAGPIQAGPDTDKPVAWVSGTFTFLNRSVHMAAVNWNYANHGKLWTYNLTYFDFLNQRSEGPAGVDTETGMMLIRDFIAQTGVQKNGFEPYPTSLRIINWVQFLSRNQIQDDSINRHLFAQASLLRRRLEYHIAGNHLLDNGFALLTAALCFQHNAWFRRAAKLVRAELSTQILTDGGHDERSPAYHQTLLDRLLDVLLAIKHDAWHNDPALVDFLEEKATRMLSWLDAITFGNGDVPMMNDAAHDIAPTTAQLRTKAVRVGLKRCLVRPRTTGFLQSTGYQKFTFSRYELVADVGRIGPDHQPGHAHADTFSFVLYVDHQPLIVDSGTSTYEIGPRRMWERSTAAHNTVDVMGLNSSEVWSGFRVGRRARVTVVTNTPTTLTARHDGYRHLGVIHERTWLAEPMCIQIRDRLLKTKAEAIRSQPGIARLHFHPDVLVSLIGTGIEAGAVRITFESGSAPELCLTTYEMADGFNRLRTAPCVEITFTNYLETILTLI